jgi:2-desacetyl-2-hydroxyethyl bacteriochlorophyllide A dehydrogenase
MGKMRAAVITTPENMTIEEVDIPQISDGEALIKVEYIGICGTDLHLLHGQYAGAEYPLIPGHEFVGTLVDIKGKGSEKYKIGDHVSAQMVISCGTCTPCAKGEDNVCSNLKMVGVHEPGGFAEYIKVSIRKMCKIPNEVDMRLAALAEPLAVAVHDIRSSDLKVGETVFIAGGGPIGVLIAIVARAAGARKVMVSEMKEFRRNFASELGFDVIDPADPDFDSKLKEYSGPEGFDVSFEVAGVQATLLTCLDNTKATGKVMIVAITSRPMTITTDRIFRKELRVQGVRIHNLYNFEGAIDLLQIPAVAKDLEKLISRVYPLEEINEAFEYAEHGEDSFKVLVDLKQ